MAKHATRARMGKTATPARRTAGTRTVTKAAGRTSARAARPRTTKKTASTAGKTVGRATGRARQYVYFFGNGKAEGDRSMRDTLGGKGAGLAEMTNAGLPVPPGFTISTDACNLWYAEGRKLPQAIEDQMVANVRKLERAAGTQLGSVENPLLVSVRSGAKFSMPGMMDTILNLGLNDDTVEGLKRRTSNGRFAYDSYRRFIQMFGNVVLEVPKDVFEHEFEAVKEEHGAATDTELGEDGLHEVVERYKKVIKARKKHFPQDPFEQLRMSRDAVFRSWNNPRAKEYRRIYEIPDHIGTAVNVQMMVFGNTGERSATGVGFTRNPATGAKEFFGEFLVNAQGEDVVAGIRTPQPIAELEKVMPKAYKELRQFTTRLEKHYKDIQDFEFTIEDDHLYMLQTRSGKRTGYAAVVIATDLVAERLLQPKEALLLVEPSSLSQLLSPVFDPDAWKKLETTTRGLPASPGAASGQVVFTADHAVEWTQQQGKKVLLVRKETVPDDIHGMFVAEGVLTATGGMTSHAAVVGRQMGKPSVVGAGELQIREGDRTLIVKGQTIKEGDWVSFDGLTGEVKLGQVATRPSEILQVVAGQMKPEESEIYQRFSKLLSWADKVRTLGIRANADLPDQAELAYHFGARGIGLCRTEHMFFGEGRIPIVQRMILADNETDRRAALEELLPLQRDDFYGVFKAMHGEPVTIRTIDPPLHEFLPKREELMVDIARLEAKWTGGSKELDEKRQLLARVEQLHEFNPMLGHRGVRLGITYPEITEMQARAIFEAACTLAKEGIRTVPEVMIPLVGHVRELRDQKTIVDRIAQEVMKEQGVRIKYLVGTMIEVPRGAITADEVAREAQFFSFGTNDLTQLTFGFSRDDAGKFLGIYQERKILERDPFQSIDTIGVGALVRTACEKGRASRADLKLGICGEHGGDPSSIHFFQEVGLHYVSASPYRVPVARLAAAQAALNVKVGD
jgi:pyruvate, orthophosphate dikinase